MPRPKAQAVVNRRIAAEREEARRYEQFMEDAERRGLRTIDPMAMAFAILISGSQPGKAEELALWNDFRQAPGFHTALNRSLRSISDMIIDAAKDSCKAACECIQPGCMISFDGSWEHRRNSRRCIVTIFCQQTKKIIDFAVIDVDHPPENSRYRSCPQNLEAMGLEKMMGTLLEKEEIVGYVHDNDGRSRILIDRLTPVGRPKLIEQIDTGHATKSLERELLKRKGIISEDLANSLRKWMRTLLHLNQMSKEDKVRAWRNCIFHFKGIHDHCPFEHDDEIPVRLGDDPVVDAELTELLKKTSWILESCNPEFSTQLNESFNRGKLKYATKDVKWGFSWEARMCCAILDRNCPYWKLHLYDKLGLPSLSQDVRNRIVALEKKRLAKKLLNSSNEKLKGEKRKWKERKNWRAENIAAVGEEIEKTAYRGNPFEKQHAPPKHRSSRTTTCDVPQKPEKYRMSSLEVVPKSASQNAKRSLTKSRIVQPISSQPSPERPSGSVPEEVPDNPNAQPVVHPNLISSMISSNSDLESLAPYQCLSDGVVDLYMSLLSKHYDNSSEIVLANSHFIHRLKWDRGGISEFWDDGVIPQVLETHKKLLIPARNPGHNDSRWILIEADFQNLLINIYDSFGKWGKCLAKDVKYFLNKQGVPGEFAIQFAQVPKQFSSYDCGIYMLHFARCIFQGTEPGASQFNHDELLAFRKEIGDALEEFAHAGDSGESYS
jgi:hypothetical protein